MDQAFGAKRRRDKQWFTPDKTRAGPGHGFHITGVLDSLLSLCSFTCGFTAVPRTAA